MHNHTHTHTYTLSPHTHTQELAEVHSRDRRQVEALHKQELSTLTNKQQGQRQLSHETEQRLEQQLRECEQRLLQLHSSQELHAHRAEHAIEEFKSQVYYYTLLE